MNKFEGILIRFECIGNKYSIAFNDMTKEQFDAMMEHLNAPITFIGGDLSQPALDTFNLTDNKPINSDWTI